jgi:hypothetical protein
MARKSPQYLPRIKNYLLPPGRTLTPMKALKLWGCSRLAVYINRLRKMGYKIKTEMVYLKNGKQYAKYSMP